MARQIVDALDAAHEKGIVQPRAATLVLVSRPCGPGPSSPSQDELKELLGNRKPATHEEKRMLPTTDLLQGAPACQCALPMPSLLPYRSYDGY